MDQERLILADNTLRRAVQVDPQNYEAHFLLARLYHKTNRPDLAKQELTVAERLRAARGPVQ